MKKRKIIYILTLIFTLFLTSNIIAQSNSDKKNEDNIPNSLSDYKYILNKNKILFRVFYGFEFFPLEKVFPTLSGQSTISAQFMSGNTFRAGIETGMIFDSGDKYFPFLATINYSLFFFILEGGIGGFIYQKNADVSFKWGIDLGMYFPVFLNDNFAIDLGIKSYGIMHEITFYRIILLFEAGISFYL